MLTIAELTWPQLEDQNGWIGLLPVGAIEAHGPHLPLATDCWIAEGMASAGARSLHNQGHRCWVLPSHSYTAAGFAGDFAGTIDVNPSATEEVIFASAQAVKRAGATLLVVVNAHFDPANVTAIRRVVDRLDSQSDACETLFFDLTRHHHAERIGGEFVTGACHAGRYEGSLMMAIRPELVDQQTAASLPPYPESLAKAATKGASSFQDLGGDQAYFGWPAEASAEEGQRTLRMIGEMMAEEVLVTLAARHGEASS